MHLIAAQFFLGLRGPEQVGGQFLPPGLNGEIGLAMGHDLFFGIGVLYDKVTGVTQKPGDLDFSVCATADANHFADVSKMVLDPMTTVETGHLRLLDHRLKVPVLRILQHVGQVAAFPKLVSRLIGALDRLEW